MRRNFDKPSPAPDSKQNSLFKSSDAKDTALEYMRQHAKSLGVDRLLGDDVETPTADAFESTLRDNERLADLETFETTLNRIMAAQYISEALVANSDDALLALNDSDLDGLDGNDIGAVMSLLTDLAGDRVKSHVDTYEVPNADNGWSSVDVAFGDHKPDDEGAYLASSRMLLSSDNDGEVQLDAYYTQDQSGHIWASTAADLEESGRLAARERNS